ncbi:MAG: hypothetical protein ACOC44_19650 [Promethearchaeia archaeon]
MTAKQEEKVNLKPLNKKQISIKIEGITPLMMEKMDMDVVERYNQKKGKKVSASDSKIEEEKYEYKKHLTDDGKIAFPSTGFLKGMTEVAPYLESLDKKKVRGSVRIIGDMIPISYKQEIKDVRHGKTSGMTKSPRKIIRPKFTEWTCKLKIQYNADNISAEQIVNLLNWSGFQCGIGGFRPECSGTFGQYKVVQSK